MGDIYVLGAGFSKTCGIAADYEMLDALNGLLPRTKDKSGQVGTCIDALRQQSFHTQGMVSFEAFMSMLSALKFLPEFMRIVPNVFAMDEQAIRGALKKYLRCVVGQIQWNGSGAPILDFVRQLDWKQDAILTFNYDLLVAT